MTVLVARATFIVLAAVAALCLVGAGLVIALSPDQTPIWLAVLLFVLVVVVVAEVVLLLMTRRAKAQEPTREPLG